MVKREGEATRIGTNQVVVSIAAPNENFGYPGDASIDYVLERGGNLGVTLCKASRASLLRS